MLKILPSTLLILIFNSCQSFNSVGHHSTQRKIANSTILKTFIDDIARKTQGTVNKMTSSEIEKKILEYIKRKEKNTSHGNWSKMGILDDQAVKINTLYDDLPYMKKIHRWVTQNITSIVPITPSTAKESYRAIINKSTDGFNPYALTEQELKALTISTRNSTSPFNSSHMSEVYIKSKIRRIKDSSIRKLYQNNYKLYNSQINSNPTASANIHSMLDSATSITKYTGRSAMGKGCKEFHKNASVEILEMKANIDLLTDKLVQIKATQKAGKSFSSIDDIPKSSRLTSQEIDESRIEAFKKVLSYTDEEARIAVGRLKRSPCQVY